MESSSNIVSLQPLSDVLIDSGFFVRRNIEWGPTLEQVEDYRNRPRFLLRNILSETDGLMWKEESNECMISEDDTCVGLDRDDILPCCRSSESWRQAA